MKLKHVILPRHLFWTDYVAAQADYVRQSALKKGGIGLLCGL
jgi:hypothetical protein